MGNKLKNQQQKNDKNPKNKKIAGNLKARANTAIIG